eukprot:COSAG04_NODE_8503_length_965_cov_1.100462_1_plen_168_part_10
MTAPGSEALALLSPSTSLAAEDGDSARNSLSTADWEHFVENDAASRIQAWYRGHRFRLVVRRGQERERYQLNRWESEKAQAARIAALRSQVAEADAAIALQREQNHTEEIARLEAELLAREVAYAELLEQHERLRERRLEAERQPWRGRWAAPEPEPAPELEPEPEPE